MVALALCALAATLVLFALSPSLAAGAQSATLSAAFSPERLGAPTRVSLGFRIAGAGGGIPSPLTAVALSYPTSLNLTRSGLGVAICQPEALKQNGPAACPPDSIMGGGSALAEFLAGPEEVIPEAASLAVVAGPPQEGYMRLLVSASGLTPVLARIVMSMVLTPGRLQFTVPLVPSLPEGEDVAVVRASITLGGRLTYYERVRGRTIAYHPREIELPSRCPKGGFRFAATFTFLDGTHASARTTISCPHGRLPNRDRTN